jgi:DNA helicase II / ATP-dependent DNA helicase PcrA
MTTTSPVKLSPEQSRIVTYNNGEGALLVVAAAGSGKTRMLTERVRYLLTQKEGRFSVLCLTFTNKAAEEMQERLSSPELIRRTNIGTFSKFALQIFIERRFSIGYEKVPHILELINDRKKVLEQVFLDNPILREYYIGKDIKTQLTMVDNYLDWIIKQKRNLVIVDEDTTQYKDWSEQRLVLYKSYNQLLREQNMIDYDDIFVLAYRALIENPAIVRLYQRNYPYILVDEAQDLSFAQYHLIRALTGDTHKNVFMVGDKNQAIHSYAGADKKYMLEDFVEDFEAKYETIEQNFRSSKEVIRFANTILQSGSNPEDAYYKGEVKIVNAFENEFEEAQWIYQKIKAMILGTDETVVLRGKLEIEGTLTLDRIAVLARNRFVFNKLDELLKEDDLFKNNYFIKKNEILYLESDLMKIFDLGTRIISNPTDQIHFQQILNFLKISIDIDDKSKEGIEKLSKLESLLLQNDDKLNQDFQTLLRAWTILSNNQSKMYDALNLIENYANYLRIDEEKQMVLSDVRIEYRNAWTKFLDNQNNINLSNFRQFLAMGVTNANKQKGLTLATVHTVKGLGFDVVFLMGMTQGTFPDYRANTDKLIQEERNTAYVAVTRAKRWLYVTYPNNKMMPWGDTKRQSPSRFISKII